MPEQTEKDFQAEVIELLKLNGFTQIYHTYDSRRSFPGFPDLIAIRPEDGYMIVWELKRDSAPEKIPDAQADWLEAFGSVKRANVAVKRPRDMEDIVKRLR